MELYLMKQVQNKRGIEIYTSKLNSMEVEYFHMLTPWQRKFITNVYDDFLTDKRLSKKQMDHIDSIYEKLMDEY